MEHLVSAQNSSNRTEYNNKKLDQRVLGKFYTPSVIGQNLSQQICEMLATAKQEQEIIICDPFAGNGALVRELLGEMKKQDLLLKYKNVRVLLLELDREALDSLEQLKNEVVALYGENVTVEFHQGDSFTSEVAKSFYSRINVLITNPPWELLKPDSREMGTMSKEEKQKYIDSLKDYDLKLASILPYSQPKKKFAGWGTNLSRCGFELSLRMLGIDGILGIVLPSSVFSDQMSENLRRHLASMTKFKKLNFYPATTRAFKGVDQDFMSGVFARSNEVKDSQSYELNIYDKDIQQASSERIIIDNCFLESNEFQIPVEHGLKFMEIMKQLSTHPKVGDFEKSNSALSIYAGRELDETGFEEKLATSGITFIKGRSISRYAYSAEAPMYVERKEASSFQSVNHPRLVWRDVARKSQVRRVHSMVIESEILCGNSLHIIYSRQDNINYLKALSVILNSMVFEAQVRSKLSTNHVSLGVVRTCHIPNLDEESISKLAELYDVKSKLPSLLKEIEIEVSELYGLNNEQLMYLAKKFFIRDEAAQLLLEQSLSH